MNKNNIELTQILGTDSLSSSRIVINDNFKIIANTLDNYQNYFGENGVYSSVIISNNENGTIDFKSDELRPAVMTISDEGVELSGSLSVHNDVILDNVFLSSIYLNDGVNEGITIYGNVQIKGDLSVTGQFPGGGSGETILTQTVTQFNDGASDGYEQLYKKGCYISPENGRNVILLSSILKLVDNMNENKLIQYTNKPFIFCGTGLRVHLDVSGGLKSIITNGHVVNDYILSDKCGSISDADLLKFVVKIYPVVSDIYNDKNIMFNIEFQTSLI